MNYILIFLWVSFFSIVFWDPCIAFWCSYQTDETSGVWFLFCYAVFVTCFVTFLFLTNLFRRKMEPSLFTMSCNLITLFFCGIVTSSMNNLTHYLHKKGPPLFDIGFFLIPEIPLQYAETSDCILVGYIMICVLRSLFLHPAVRNKMWADFGRISSIMILCKVRFILVRIEFRVLWDGGRFCQDLHLTADPDLRITLLRQSRTSLSTKAQCSATLWTAETWFSVDTQVFWWLSCYSPKSCGKQADRKFREHGDCLL